MGEMVAWSRDAGIGTPKHPPLAAWLVGAWFKFFPQQDWAYYLFAMVLATFALWVAWRVSERTLDGEKRVAGLLLLTFIPFFNFHALKYNANTVLIPLWALCTWFFVRSFETRSALWAALAGAAAAAAMMGKYWSILPAFAAMLAKVEIVSLWAMSAMTLLPVVLLSAPLLTVPRRVAAWLLVAAIAFPTLMVLASPFIAIWVHREGVPNYATHYRLLAQAVDKVWHEKVNAPLRYLGSYT